MDLPGTFDGKAPQRAGASRRRGLLVGSILAVLFGSALAVRATHVEESRMIAEVQYRSALIARSFLFRMSPDVPRWRRVVNRHSVERLPTKEPSVMPLLAAGLYRVTGTERPALGGLLSTLAWLVGGVFLFLLLSELVSPAPALLATAYYLFVPLGVHASTSFISDPLMICLFIISLYAIWKYFEERTRGRLLAAAACSGLAILVKPLVLFPVIASFLFLAGASAGSWKRALGRDELLYLAIALILGTTYYAHGIFVDRSIAPQAEVSFVPELLATRAYWRGWLLTALAAVGTAPPIAALVGLPMLSAGRPRALALGLGVGYLALGLAFTYHIQFATHYHLQLVVLVALGLAPLLELVTRGLRDVAPPWLGRTSALGVLGLVGLLTVRAIRHEFAVAGDHEPAAVAREVGEIVGHSHRVAYVGARYYGRPLEYLGELSGAYWPRRVEGLDRRLGRAERSVEERLDALGFAPEYFVITDRGEFERHHADLREYLDSSCVPLAESDAYLVYHACGAEAEDQVDRAARTPRGR